MHPDELLERQKAQIDRIIDSLLLDPLCEEELFQARYMELIDVEIPYAEGLRQKWDQMFRDGKIFGAMAEAYERSIGEMLGPS